MAELIKPQEVVNGGYVRAAPTSVRFDSTQFSPMIINVAMLKHVIPTIGEELYAALLSSRTVQVANYNPSLGTVYPMFPADAYYEELWVDGGLEALTASSVVLTWLPYGTIQNRSVGQQQLNTNYSQNADIKGIQFMSDTLQNDINLLKTAVRAFLRKGTANNCSLENTNNSDETAPYNFIIY